MPKILENQGVVGLRQLTSNTMNQDVFQPEHFKA